MGVMAGLRPGEYVEVVEKAFAKCPRFRGLRFLSAEVRHGFLAVRFEGPVDDYRGPYGIIVRLPGNAQDELGTQHGGAGVESVAGSAAGSVQGWAHSAVAMPALEAQAATRNQARPYSPDGVWWLSRETTG
jgi:hypothetical protein